MWHLLLPPLTRSARLRAPDQISWISPHFLSLYIVYLCHLSGEGGRGVEYSTIGSFEEFWSHLSSDVVRDVNAQQEQHCSVL